MRRLCQSTQKSKKYFDKLILIFHTSQMSHCSFRKKVDDWVISAEEKRVSPGYPPKQFIKFMAPGLPILFARTLKLRYDSQVLLAQYQYFKEEEVPSAVFVTLQTRRRYFLLVAAFL